MLVPLFPLLWLFFCYSFLGWVLETAVSAVRLHRYVDRSVLFGPLCACYGITAVLLTVGLPELRGNYFFLFLGSAICSTVVEWIAGHLLEKATHTRWWDYSNRRGNLDGYICVGSFLLWGVLGLAAVQWINPLLLALYRWLPPLVGEILLWVLLALLAADIAGTVLTLCGVRSSLPPLENLNSRLAALSVRLGEWILRRAEGRIQKAHPGAGGLNPGGKNPPRTGWGGGGGVINSVGGGVSRSPSPARSFPAGGKRPPSAPLPGGPAFTAFCSCSLLAEWPVIWPKPSSAASKWAGG